MNFCRRLFKADLWLLRTLADIGVWIGYAQIGKDPEYAIIQAIASINTDNRLLWRMPCLDTILL